MPLFFHMTMSSADNRVYVKGIPLFMLIVYMIFIAVIKKVTHIIFKNFVEKQERKKI